MNRVLVWATIALAVLIHLGPALATFAVGVSILAAAKRLAGGDRLDAVSTALVGVLALTAFAAAAILAHRGQRTLRAVLAAPKPPGA